MRKKILALILSLIFVLFLILLGVIFTYIVKLTNIEKEVQSFLERNQVTSYTKVTTLISSATSELDKILDSVILVDNLKNKLSSSVLKLEFTYKKDFNGFAILNSKTANRITLTSNALPNKVQYIEIFTKKADESLEQSIKRIFLNGVPENICKYNKLTSKYKFLNTSWQYANIISGSNVNPTQCPTPFTLNSVTADTFFIYNPKFPERFAFLYLDSPFFEGNLPDSYWFESIEFLE